MTAACLRRVLICVYNPSFCTRKHLHFIWEEVEVALTRTESKVLLFVDIRVEHALEVFASLQSASNYFIRFW